MKELLLRSYLLHTNWRPLTRRRLTLLSAARFTYNTYLTGSKLTWKGCLFDFWSIKTNYQVYSKQRLLSEPSFSHMRSSPPAISHCISHDAPLLSQQHFAISDLGGGRISREGIGSAERRDDPPVDSSSGDILSLFLRQTGPDIVFRCVLFGCCEWAFPAWAQAKVSHQLSDFPASS